MLQNKSVDLSHYLALQMKTLHMLLGTAYPLTHFMLKYQCLEKPAITVFRAEAGIIRYTVKMERESYYAIPALIC